MRRVRADERGSAVLIAIMVMALIVMLGLASFSYVDGQTKASEKERARDSTFNYGEGVLNVEAFIAGQNWPSATTSLPDCSYSGGTVTATGGSVSSCPSAATLGATFTNNDYANGVTWTAKVRDNSGTDTCQAGTGSGCGYYYTDSAFSAAPRYDANSDNMMWVRSRTTIGNHSRTEVALVQVQKVTLDMPHNVLTANTVTSTYSPKLRINPGTAKVALRCPTAAPGSYNCTTLKRQSQQLPQSSIDVATGGPAMTPEALQQLRDRALAEGEGVSHFATCPTTRPPGPLVFIESGNCTQASLPLTSAANPAVYVIVNGTLNIGGSGDFYGLIYLVNAGNLTGNVFDSNGNHNWHGSINVDGPGNVNLGTSSNTSLTFDANVFNGLYAYANGSIVRPSYREIQSSQP